MARQRACATPPTCRRGSTNMPIIPCLSETETPYRVSKYLLQSRSPGSLPNAQPPSLLRGLPEGRPVAHQALSHAWPQQVLAPVQNPQRGPRANQTLLHILKWILISLPRAELLADTGSHNLNFLCKDYSSLPSHRAGRKL